MRAKMVTINHRFPHQQTGGFPPISPRSPLNRGKEGREGEGEGEEGDMGNNNSNSIQEKVKTRLTAKQRKFMEAYIETGNLAESARRAGSKATNTHTQSTAGWEMLRQINMHLNELMAHVGLTDVLLLIKLKEGLEATKVERVSHQGVFIDERVSIDFPTRAKYLELATKVSGMQKEKVEHSGPGGKPVFGEMGEQLTDLLGAILAK